METAVEPVDDLTSQEGDVLAFQSDMAIVLPMVKGASRWTRPAEGWATTYGVIGDGGRVVETSDRENEIMEAAKVPNGIDWSEYRQRGFWNDSHTDRKVAVPDDLAYHGLESAFAQQHGKVGWYTTGHLFDRSDPESYGSFQPTRHEIERADHFWELGRDLQKGGRTLGLSIQGKKLRSGNRIKRAWVSSVALLEYPHNPDATIEAMGKGLGDCPAVISLASSLRLQYRISERDALDAARKLWKSRGNKT